MTNITLPSTSTVGPANQQTDRSPPPFGSPLFVFLLHRKEAGPQRKGTLVSACCEESFLLCLFLLCIARHFLGLATSPGTRPSANHGAEFTSTKNNILSAYWAMSEDHEKETFATMNSRAAPPPQPKLKWTTRLFIDSHSSFLHHLYSLGEDNPS